MITIIVIIINFIIIIIIIIIITFALIASFDNIAWPKRSLEYSNSRCQKSLKYSLGGSCRLFSKVSLYIQ